MGRKKNDTAPAAEVDEAVSTALDELLESGSVTLTAGTRKDVYVLSEALSAAIPADVKWTRNLAFFDGRQFTQMYSITKK